MSQVSESIPMHTLYKLFFAIEDLETLLFVFVEEIELFGDVLKLGRKGHMLTFLVRVDEQIKFFARFVAALVFLNLESFKEFLFFPKRPKSLYLLKGLIVKIMRILFKVCGTDVAHVDSEAFAFYLHWKL